MSNNISRRAVAKGAAWSVPVVMGTSVVPSYASSRELKYRFGQNSYVGYEDFDNCRTEFQVTTDVVRSAVAHWRGFAPTYFSGEAVDTRAHLEYVEFVVTFPKGMVPERSWTIHENSAWSVKKEPWTWVNLGDGGQADVSKMDVFVFRFHGNMDGQVRRTTKTVSWLDSNFTATASNPNLCGRDRIQVYYGFAYKYTTDNGYTVKGTTISPMTLVRGRN